MKGIPKYRHHKASGLGVVTLSGRDHYLGRYGTPASKAEYLARVAEWEASGRTGDPPDFAVIDDLAERYLKFAALHYRKRGRKTASFGKASRVCGLLRELYGPLPIGKFGVVQFKAIRHQWITRTSRRTANQYADQLREVFRWGVEAGLVPVEVLQALKAVSPLERGRSVARETSPIKPAPDAAIEAVKPLVNRLALAKIELQLLTGMRPGEVCGIRTCDLARTVNPWVYTPAQHKTEHHDKDRVIPLGPKAQAILTTYLDPADPRRLILAAPNSARKFHDGLADTGGLVSSYYQIVKRACDLAGVEHWHPSQLRHNAATELRRRYGIEAAQLALGHSRSDTTEIYAERNLDVVSRIAAEAG